MLLVCSKLRFANYDFRSNHPRAKLLPNLGSESLDRKPPLCQVPALGGEPGGWVGSWGSILSFAACQSRHPHEGMSALKDEKIEEGNWPISKGRCIHISWRSNAK